MHDLLIVGAGPYGLSVASHAAAAGLDVRIFGRPMASWRDNMPRGMFLKSEPWASDLSDPAGRFGLAAYCAREGLPAEHGRPLPIEHFASYGLWFAEQASPRVDERLIASVRPFPGGYEARTEDGEAHRARAVALAVGVLPFTEIPRAVRGLGAERVSHSSHHADLARFRGRDVTVLGAGQAALETAALLSEQGTKVRILARSPRVDWNTVPPAWRRPWRESLRAPHTGLGCGWRNKFYADTPGLFRLLPEPARARVAADALGPAGAWWIKDRVEPRVEVRVGHRIASAESVGGRVRVHTVAVGGGGLSFATDHIIAATGFRATADRIGVLPPELRDGLRRLSDGTPYVSDRFETSHPGLFLAGLTTASSFGPAMRFVYGAAFTAERLVRGVERHVRRGRRAAPPVQSDDEHTRRTAAAAR
ncbi:dimethylaniline monooxygenase [Streptomyces venezuelae]|uniref:L-lysine N6-monooxygenase MbtG n=1 Tax=Streptomyces venezuelae TaxID=54571 RepID=A0A5P2C1B7_STRVZ|nr:FAD-dependent oxidoreductase [Streptomyces venezuelae]QES35081.1 dimethylaniline monooxygenase [Streptomyces venezuelae]